MRETAAMMHVLLCLPWSKSGSAPLSTFAAGLPLPAKGREEVAQQGSDRAL
jgi:hypothetical protein